MSSTEQQSGAIIKDRKVTPMVDSLEKRLSDVNLKDREKNYLMREAMGIEDKFESSSCIDDSQTNGVQEQPGKSYFDEFWNDRYKDCRLFGIAITLINFAFEIQ